jgi:hypothetical protein
LFLVDYEATRRGTYIVRDTDGKIRIAAEPPPDVAFESTAKLLASLSDAVSKAEAGKIDGEVVEKIVNLTERTQAVVIMRDAMFRLAEMHLNGAIDTENYHLLYNKALAGSIVLAAADNEKAVELIIRSFVDSVNTERIAKLVTQAKELAQTEVQGDPSASESRAIILNELTKEIRRISTDPVANPNPIDSLLTDHPTVPLREVDGRYAIQLALRDEAGTRATNNFDAEWSGTRKFRVILRNVPQELQENLSFQLKRDEKWLTDSNVGGPFKPGSIVEIGGSRLYLAERDFDASKILRAAPNATILLVEEGLDPDRVQ